MYMCTFGLHLLIMKLHKFVYCELGSLVETLSSIQDDLRSYTDLTPSLSLCAVNSHCM